MVFPRKDGIFMGYVSFREGIPIYFGATMITTLSRFFLSPLGLLSHNPQRQCPALLTRLPHSVPHFPGTEKHQTTTLWCHIREDLMVRGSGGFLPKAKRNVNGLMARLGWSLIKASKVFKSKIIEPCSACRVFSLSPWTSLPNLDQTSTAKRSWWLHRLLSEKTELPSIARLPVIEVEENRHHASQWAIGRAKSQP